MSIYDYNDPDIYAKLEAENEYLRILLKAVLDCECKAWRWKTWDDLITEAREAVKGR